MGKPLGSLGTIREVRTEGVIAREGKTSRNRKNTRDPGVAGNVIKINASPEFIKKKKEGKTPGSTLEGGRGL